MLYEINREAFNAVIACAAIDDVRYYLNGFFVDVTNSALVATNGHVLAKAPLKRINRSGGLCNPQTHGALQGFLFQRLQRPLSKRYGDWIDIDCENGKLHFPDARFRKLSPGVRIEVQLEPIDGKFPEYTRVAVGPKGPQAPVSEFGLNPEYLAKPARWAGYSYAKTYVEFRGKENTDPVFVTYAEKGLEDVEITLMKVRR